MVMCSHESNILKDRRINILEGVYYQQIYFSDTKRDQTLYKYNSKMERHISRKWRLRHTSEKFTLQYMLLRMIQDESLIERSVSKAQTRQEELIAYNNE